MSNIVSYHGCPEFERLRTVYDTNSGKLYFCMVDLSFILGYELMIELMSHAHSSDVTTRRKMIVITKRGLLDFLQSNKTDKALRIENWLTKYVLPSIKKEVEFRHTLLRRMRRLEKYLRESMALKEENDFLYEESMYFRYVLQSPRLVQTQQIADDYGISKRELNRMLRKFGIIYWENGEWFLRPEYEDCNFTDIEVKTIEGSDGASMEVEEQGWTQQGRLFIYDFLVEIGVFPLSKEQREMKKKNK